ncbi:hypothetical protein L6164_026197 [Bauhinia variegata]|uniref:Uncharacterized protein n=1 Tax=Bauhinia variegata TaxID=167791 RepID=A0ACB9LPD0_BAUVA|nr:hypothetical protein L6164_026197 [Bauhinia variegata]
MDPHASERTLEVTVLSCENLNMGRKPVAKNVYVVFRTESLNSFTTRMEMAEGGSCLSWNEKFLVDMPMHAGSITFEVQCKTSIGIKSIGEAKIMVSDFLCGTIPETNLQFLSYRLRDKEGRRNGIINFSVRVMSPQYSPALVKSEEGTSIELLCRSNSRIPTQIDELCPITTQASSVNVVSNDGYGGLQIKVQSSANQAVTGIPVYW